MFYASISPVLLYTNLYIVIVRSFKNVTTDKREKKVVILLIKLFFVIILRDFVTNSKF